MLPTIINDLTPLCGVGLVALVLGGYLVHEAMHVFPLALAGVDYEVRFAPGEAAVWRQLLVGRVFEYRAEGVGRGLAVVSLLAPGVLALSALPVWAAILASERVSLTLTLAVAAWVVVFLPSLGDWLGVYHVLQSGGDGA